MKTKHGISKALMACGALALALAVVGPVGAQDSAKKGPTSVPSKSPLVGSWRLAWLDSPGADGKIQRVTDSTGSLIYAPSGRMSVQVMEAKASDSDTDYSKGGYEASFGRFSVDEKARTVTHFVEGANVRALIGKSLPRRYRFEGGRLIVQSTNPKERWSVAWERVR